MDTRGFRPGLVFTDLDGTLLSSRKTIAPGDADAVRRAGQVCPIIAATARPPRATRLFCEDLELAGPVICYNGARIVDIRTGERIADYRIDPLVGETVLEGIAARWPRVWVSIECDDQWWTDRPPPAALTESAKLAPPDRIAPLREFYGHPFSKLLLSEPEPILSEMLHWLRTEFAEHLHVLVTVDGNLLQMMSPHAGKRRAAELLAARYGVPREHVMAIGDDRNDLEILEWAGLSVAMANAIDEVRERVDHVTASNDDGGVGMALRRFVLNED